MNTEKASDIKALFTAAFAFLTALWGWLGWAVAFLVLAMIIDYITGTMAARACGEWSSAAARAGLRHKLGTVIAVGVAAFADLGLRVALNSDVIPGRLRGIDWPQGFTMVVTFWYFLTELGSILENAGKLGAPIHPWIRKGIAVLKATVTPEEGEPAERIVSAADTMDGGIDIEKINAEWEDVKRRVDELVEERQQDGMG